MVCHSVAMLLWWYMSFLTCRCQLKSLPFLASVNVTPISRCNKLYQCFSPSYIRTLLWWEMLFRKVAKEVPVKYRRRTNGCFQRQNMISARANRSDFYRSRIEPGSSSWFSKTLLSRFSWTLRRSFNGSVSHWDLTETETSAIREFS